MGSSLNWGSQADEINNSMVAILNFKANHKSQITVLNCFRNRTSFSEYNLRSFTLYNN